MLTLLLALVQNPQNASTHASVFRWEFIFIQPPVPSVHASTIAESREGLVAAWFGGSGEGNRDVGIWSARMVDGKWTPPAIVATGEQSDGTRFPTWNPVLAPWPDGTLRLFYKVGPSPARWWGMVSVSRDAGRTWSPGERLPAGILGPIKNKPVWLPNGDVVSPSSTESPEQPSRWRIHFERSSDSGRSWTRVSPWSPDTGAINAIQPTILVHRDGRLQALGRTRSGLVFESWSPDQSRSWSPLRLTQFPNPNSGIDGVTLRDGRQVLVYNHTRDGRSNLFVALSNDGRAWHTVLELEGLPGEYSYPSVIQGSDGNVHLTYTWNRNHIMYVAFDPARLR